MTGRQRLNYRRLAEDAFSMYIPSSLPGTTAFVECASIPTSDLIDIAHRLMTEAANDERARIFVGMKKLINPRGKI